MTIAIPIQTDSKLDLVLERVIDVSPELVWTAWTKPEHLKKWFTPAPWTVPDCEIDLRQGGIFRTVMRGPNGEEFTNIGCYLEVVPPKRLIWTDALLPDYRPSKNPFFTAILTFEAEGKGTRYKALVIHMDEAGRKRHEEMGFHNGWSTALDQLVSHAKAM